ncbi:ABC transporter permease [Paenibacillus harenae]|uniref:ABC transporter permease n=1 Tax=Paenibacillus harenae TaxID=306543 RepID=UPI00041DE441|nr:ABC transporter permease [Paenibacillus harenae]
MGSLILNENMKLYRRPRTWAMLGFMVAIVLFLSIMDWYHNDKRTEGDEWRNVVIEEKQQRSEILNDPKLNEENRSYNEQRVAILDYHLEHDIRPEEGTMWDAINGTAGLTILITLFTVIVAGDSLAGEFSGGTIKLLLIRPASRLKILVSKYISMLMFGILLLLILFIVSILFNGLIYRFGNIDLPLVMVNTEGEIVERNMVATLWKTYLFNGVSTIMFVTMAFMISSAFRSSAMAIGFSIFALFAGTIVSEVLQAYEWSKFILFSNLDLTQYLTGRPYQEGMTLTFSAVVLSAYFILFNLVSWLVFTKRDVAA